MGNINHKGIPVKSSVYPDDWKPESVDSYHDFMTDVVLQNLRNEGRLEGFPQFGIEIRSKKPVAVGEIIRHVLSKSEGYNMNGLVHQANEILKGGDA